MIRRSKPLVWLASALLLCGSYHSAGQKTDDLQIPPKRAHHSLAFDAVRGEVILYGGSTAAQNDSFTFFDDVWSWNGQRWQRHAATGLPRSSHFLVYDSGRKRLLSIAGMAGQERFGETRSFDGKSWVLLANNPALALVDTAVAYDARRNRVVLFGGMRADRTTSNETWEFDGENWIQVATAGPGPINSPMMVYDEARKVSLLFGRTNDQSVISGQTWQWNGSVWSQVSAEGPPARWAAGFTYDVKNKQAVLFGGGSRNGALADTWLWDGERWQEAKVPGPSGRLLPAMTYDRRRSVVVLFGGRIKYPDDSNDTWEWNGKQWKQVSQ
jgi:Kelch motif